MKVDIFVVTVTRVGEAVILVVGGCVDDGVGGKAVGGVERDGDGDARFDAGRGDMRGVVLVAAADGE